MHWICYQGLTPILQVPFDKNIAVLWQRRKDCLLISEVNILILSCISFEKSLENNNLNQWSSDFPFYISRHCRSQERRILFLLFTVTSGWWAVFHIGETQGNHWNSGLGRTSKGCPFNVQLLSSSVQSFRDEPFPLPSRSTSPLWHLLQMNTLWAFPSLKLR